MFSSCFVVLHTYVIQSDLTYLHTSVSGGFVDKVRELDK